MKYQIQLIVDGDETSAAVSPAYPGDYVVRMDGDFGGSTVKLQLQSPDGTNWMDIPDASMTDEGMFSIQLPGEIPIRAVVTGGTPSGLYVSVDRLQV